MELDLEKYCFKLFEKKGAVIFNADQEAKKHLKHTKILQNRIIDAFGQKVVEKIN